MNPILVNVFLVSNNMCIYNNYICNGLKSYIIHQFISGTYAIVRMIGLCRFQPIPPWLKSPNTQRCPTIDES